MKNAPTSTVVSDAEWEVAQAMLKEINVEEFPRNGVRIPIDELKKYAKEKFPEKYNDKIFNHPFIIFRKNKQSDFKLYSLPKRGAVVYDNGIESKVKLGYDEEGKLFVVKIRTKKLKHNMPKVVEESSEQEILKDLGMEPVLFQDKSKSKKQIMTIGLSDVWLAEDEFFEKEYVLEEFGGVSLKKLIDSGVMATLDNKIKKEISKRLISNLKFIHEKDILHCDLHSGNVLIDLKIEDGKIVGVNNVKIIDFGLSRKIKDKTDAKVIVSLELGLVNMLILDPENAFLADNFVIYRGLNYAYKQCINGKFDLAEKKIEDIIEKYKKDNELIEKLKLIKEEIHHLALYINLEKKENVENKSEYDSDQNPLDIGYSTSQEMSPKDMGYIDEKVPKEMRYAKPVKLTTDDVNKFSKDQNDLITNVTKKIQDLNMKISEKYNKNPLKFSKRSDLYACYSLIESSIFAAKPDIGNVVHNNNENLKIYEEEIKKKGINALYELTDKLSPEKRVARKQSLTHSKNLDKENILPERQFLKNSSADINEMEPPEALLKDFTEMYKTVEKISPTSKDEKIFSETIKFLNDIYSLNKSHTSLKIENWHIDWLSKHHDHSKIVRKLK